MSQSSFDITSDAARELGVADSELGAIMFDRIARPAYKWSHYLPAYEAELAEYRSQPVRFLELGVFHGGSLQMWREWFPPGSVIFGVDIDPGCAAIDDDEGINVRIGSQADPAFLRGVVEEMGGVDIVLDDGSHVAEHQLASLRALFPILAEGGTYVVEDLHTSYWREYGGRHGRGEGFVEQVKTLIDDMHGWYHPKGPAIPEVDAQHWMPRIAIYDSMVFLRKVRRSRPQAFWSGT